jgi:glycosyltransferase involved in cell wall biosynthesis
MHRALVVTTDPAWPPTSGADLRSWQNATALAELGPVTVASVQPLETARPPPHPDIAVVGLTEKKERAPALRRRTSIDRKILRPVVYRLSRLASGLRPHTVVIEGINLHPLLDHVRPFTENLVLDLHNIESDLAAQLRDTRSALARWCSRVVGRDPERILEAELAATRVVDRIWLCSPEDQQRLVSAVGGTVRSHVVPNGVPRIAEFSNLPPPPSRGADWPVVLFVGHLGYIPNVRAVVRLAKKIMPLIQARLPRSRLQVVGRSPALRIRKLHADGALELVANPSEVSTYLKCAYVVIAPLDIGGGTRIKLLEAMAAGVPVVATPLAAEGLGLLDDVHVALASTDRELADGALGLCSDTDRWLRQRAIARRYVMETFGPAAISRSVRSGLGCGPQNP